MNQKILFCATVALASLTGSILGCGSSKVTAQRGASLSKEDLKKIKDANRILKLASTPAKMDVVFNLAQKIGPKDGSVLPETPSEILQALLDQEFKVAKKDARFSDLKQKDLLSNLKEDCAEKLPEASGFDSEVLATTTVEPKKIEVQTVAAFWATCVSSFKTLQASEAEAPDSVFSIWQSAPASSQEKLALAQLLALLQTRSVTQRAGMNAVAVLTKNSVYAGFLSAIAEDKEDLKVTLLNSKDAEEFGTLRNSNAPLNVLDAEYFLGFIAVKDLVKNPDLLLKQLIDSTRVRYNLISIDEVALPQTKEMFLSTL
jgi:hypothetical protein